MPVCWIDKEKLHKEFLAGTFLNLASTSATEIAAEAGFDWLLLDFEHGSGDLAALRPMLLACRGSHSSPIVRIRSVDPDTVKFVMDSGAAGIMFPFVSDVASAQRAIAAIKYPPVGERGVAGIIRATNYGRDWAGYFAEANRRSLVVVQLETVDAISNAADIAALDEVDVLFVGPLDLSASMGFPGDFSRPEFKAKLQSVVDVCGAKGKTPGILSRPEWVKEHKAMGFRFFALGSDSGGVVSGMQTALQTMHDA